MAGVVHDSRAVSRGAVFVAIPGRRADGAAFAADAIGRGAIAVVSESPAPSDVRVPWIRPAFRMYAPATRRPVFPRL